MAGTALRDKAIRGALAAAGLLPAEHLVDAGDVAADHLVSAAREHRVGLAGPAPADIHWQARTPGAFAADCVAIDRGARRATCPQGRRRAQWAATHDPNGNADIVVSSPPAACLARPCRARCTRSTRGPRRRTLRPRAPHLALRAARARQAAPEFAARYAARAGVEGTISGASPAATCAMPATAAWPAPGCSTC